MFVTTLRWALCSADVRIFMLSFFPTLWRHKARRRVAAWDRALDPQLPTNAHLLFLQPSPLYTHSHVGYCLVNHNYLFINDHFCQTGSCWPKLVEDDLCCLLMRSMFRDWEMKVFSNDYSLNLSLLFIQSIVST